MLCLPIVWKENCGVEIKDNNNFILMKKMLSIVNNNAEWWILLKFQTNLNLVLPSTKGSDQVYCEHQVILLNGTCFHICLSHYQSTTDMMSLSKSNNDYILYILTSVDLDTGMWFWPLLLLLIFFKERIKTETLLVWFSHQLHAYRGSYSILFCLFLRW